MTWQCKHTSTSEELAQTELQIVNKFSFRVSRKLLAFSEMTNMDPDYAGPEFDFDKIIKELMNKVRENCLIFAIHLYQF